MELVARLLRPDVKSEAFHYELAWVLWLSSWDCALRRTIAYCSVGPLYLRMAAERGVGEKRLRLYLYTLEELLCGAGEGATGDAGEVEGWGEGMVEAGLPVVLGQLASRRWHDADIPAAVARLTQRVGQVVGQLMSWERYRGGGGDGRAAPFSATRLCGVLQRECGKVRGGQRGGGETAHGHGRGRATAGGGSVHGGVGCRGGGEDGAEREADC